MLFNRFAVEVVTIHIRTIRLPYKRKIENLLFFPVFAARTTAPLGRRSGSIRQPFSRPLRLANHEGHQGHEDTSILVFFVSFVVGAASCLIRA